MTKQGGWPASGFGQKLRALREERGLSQFQLAIKAACRSETVSRLERGEQEPAWPLVLALANALGVECTAFKGGIVASGQAEDKPPRAKPAQAKKGERKKGGALRPDDVLLWLRAQPFAPLETRTPATGAAPAEDRGQS